ncbi:MAG: 4Fe-4S dicluster domain-containing protein [Chitinivibrionales bacterium]|nr:4Fe-4S dicluster domain-containing protein [Chitinivibrionales bacterium]MBD3394087.1 4Fe-4S dicluster domain-containing protein [Chitinivibrionales bacterium]
MAAKVDSAACDACGTCVSVCPTRAIRCAPEVPVVDEGTCIACGRCVKVCPIAAIRMEETNRIS